MTGPEVDVTVDAVGRPCPVPVIRLATAARGLPPGTVVAVLADDPAAVPDVAAWARMRGHEHLGNEPLPGPQARPDRPVRRHVVRLR